MKIALCLGPEYPQIHYRYGDWLHKYRRSLEALPYARKPIELSPAHKEARQLWSKINEVTDYDINITREYAEQLKIGS